MNWQFLGKEITIEFQNVDIKKMPGHQKSKKRVG
jgi:hypothetical protein